MPRGWPHDRIERVAREAFGFDGAAPGTARGDRGRARGPRHARRSCRRARASRRSTRSPGCCSPGATVVVSPLIALQRDQVDDLRARAAGGAAQLNSTVGRSERERGAGRAGRGRAGVPLPRPRAARQPGRARRAGDRPAVAAGRRRGALHLRVGPRLPAGLPAARRGGRGARAPDRARPDRDGGAARPRGDRRAARAARPGDASSAASTGRTSGSRSSASTTRTASSGRCASTWRAPRRPGSSTSPRGAAPRSSPRRCARARRARGRVPRGDAARRARRRPGALHGRRPRRASWRRRRSGWASTSRTSAGSSTRRSPSRSTATTRRSGAPGATASRAGRSLFYRAEDVGLRRFFAGGGQVDLAEIGRVLDAVDGRRPGRAVGAAGGDRAVARPSWRPRSRGSRTRARSRCARRGEVAPADDAPPPKAAIEAAAAAEERRREFDRSRVDMMRALRGDRRAAAARSCSRTSASRSSRRAATATTATPGGVDARRRPSVPFAVGARVAHDEWGEGVVQRYEEDAVVVLFDEVGYKTLALDVVLERGLLSPA